MRPSHRKNNPDWVPGPKAWLTIDGNRPAFSATDILKDTWPRHGDMITPKWARDAYARHWMTLKQRSRVPKVAYKGGGISEEMYEKMPLLVAARRVK